MAAETIKEKYGYVCKDLVQEFKKFDEKKKDEKTGQWVLSNKFKKHVHKAPNGDNITIDVGYERFLGPEMFFHPEFMSKGDFTTPLDEVLD